jgi:AcrR family transcriptional regulator
MAYRQTEQVVRRLAARHDAILAAAGEIAAEGGMAAVQIAPVAQRAGIAAGTVYRYFPSKSDLVAALACMAARALRAGTDAVAACAARAQRGRRARPRAGGAGGTARTVNVMAARQRAPLNEC